MSFFPADKDVPDILETEEFVLVPLRPGHLQLDYDAVMSSQEVLRMWSGSDWPRSGFTLEENLADLVWHDQEHRDRVAFTYTVLNAGQSVCLGCVYVRPLADLVNGNPEKLDDIGDDEAIVRFWVRASRLDSGLDMHLLKSLRRWFAQSWYFSHLYFHTRSANLQQIALFEEANLARKMSLHYSDRGGTHYFYEAVPIT